MKVSMAAAFRTAALVALLLGSAASAAADDPCLGFKWDLTRERELFSSPASATVDASTLPLPIVATDSAVDVALRPQASVRFAIPPAKPMLADGAFAGLVNFRVTAPGIYRIALAAPFWIDVLVDGEALTSVDFGGPGNQCPPPVKVVTYNLPAGKLLTLQLSGATERQVRLSITPAP